MQQEKVQDDITIILKAQKTIVHETVRINVGISAQVASNTSETDFRSQIHSTLRDFIDTEWKIQSIQRHKGSSNFEQVTVQATARVPEKENYQLSERATQLSCIGFELINPTVDYSLTFDEIQSVNRGLRLSLFNQALQECDAYNEAQIESGGYQHGNYRVASSRFDADYNADYNAGRVSINPINAMMMATNASPMPKGGSVYQEETVGGAFDCAGEGTQDLNVSTRFEMTGQFVLRGLRE